jgi:hypothetical protein
VSVRQAPGTRPLHLATSGQWNGVADAGTVVDDAGRHRLATKEQHEHVYESAQTTPRSVYYAFPFYLNEPKLLAEVPDLLNDRWLLNVGSMPSGPRT